MNVIEKIATKSVLAMLWLMLKELRRLNYAIEIGVDTLRVVHGHRPVFHVERPDNGRLTVDDAEDGRTIPRYQNDEPEFLRRDLLEHLAREHHIAFDGSTDLVQIGKELGWLTSSGEFVQLPQGYGD